ncbi:hypothetical protein SAMN05444166_1879 [Singulisphaera sp. GP187]|uniref:hypothetical protein n=1 Tax=Singulisphaera sp. GP187 TaxID=1882752 RepID=UPI00092B7F48|nr:hypothetical protein [Singulisphaera sp. GP187]SIN97817.1 hypothetical protein SAMN05444166_1879 [Singulisphaera sp. GP187]
MNEQSAFAKGAAWALGLELHWIGPSLCLSEEDAEKLVRMTGNREIPHRKERAKATA